MANITQGNCTLNIKVQAYHYVEETQTDEWYYAASITYLNQPLFYTPIHPYHCDDLTEAIDFELHDSRLSDTLQTALTTQCGQSMDMTWEGGFDLDISPRTADQQNWSVKITIGSLFFGSVTPEHLSFSLDFFAPQAEWQRFSDELQQEEDYRKNHPL